MDLWLVTIENWPHATNAGGHADQVAAGARSANYPVRAVDIKDALMIAEAIVMGIKSNPRVWRAPITGIVRAPVEKTDD